MIVPYYLNHGVLRGLVQGILLIITILIGTTEGNLFWDTLRDQLLGKPSEEIIECQKPKPILIHTGEVMHPTVIRNSECYTT